jgi:hypothetical protein
VEDTLFRVPCLYFEQHSKFFRDRFQLSGIAAGLPNKLPDTQPLRLDGVAITDFRQLLKVIFLPIDCQQENAGVDNPQTSTMSWRDWASVYKLSNDWCMETIREKALEKISTLPVNIEEWTAVLRLSTAWGMSGTRKKAIQRLNDYEIDAMTLIDLAMQCKVPHWLLRGYQKLVQRYEDITVEEIERLSWKTTSILLRIRDRYLSSDRHRRPASYSYNPAADLRSDFCAELKEATIMD